MRSKKDIPEVAELEGAALFTFSLSSFLFSSTSHLLSFSSLLSSPEKRLQRPSPSSSPRSLASTRLHRIQGSLVASSSFALLFFVQARLSLLPSLPRPKKGKLVSTSTNLVLETTGQYLSYTLLALVYISSSKKFQEDEEEGHSFLTSFSSLPPSLSSSFHLQLSQPLYLRSASLA